MKTSKEKFLKYESSRDAVFVFGAGASYAEGAPLQSELLPYILSGEDPNITGSNFGKAVVQFIKANFHISNSFFPTLECVFSYLDYFIKARESLGGDLTTSRIAELRESLIGLIHYTVAKKRKEGSSVYRKFWHSAKEHSLNIGVVTLNYDTLLDEAFDFLYANFAYIDYSIHLMNYDWYDKYYLKIDPFNWWENPREPVPIWGDTNPRPIKIIKLHGSLNWKYCNCCNQVLHTPWKSEINLHTMGFMRDDYRHGDHTPNAVEFLCPLDSTRFETLISPPSYIKNLEHPIFNRLREEAAREIRCAKRIVFIGYSFPEADVHIKALFKKNASVETELLVINRTLSEKIISAYLSIGRKITFREVAFEKALEDPNLVREMFGK